MPSEQRLHPSSVLFSFGKSLKALAVPGILVLVFGRSSGPSVSLWPAGPDLSGVEVWAMLLLIPAAVVAVVRYLTFRLIYEGDELVIRQGILFRSVRHVPYARIQNLNAVRNVLAPGPTIPIALSRHTSHVSRLRDPEARRTHDPAYSAPTFSPPSPAICSSMMSSLR